MSTLRVTGPSTVADWGEAVNALWYWIAIANLL
jgi:hypothetical protein